MISLRRITTRPLAHAIATTLALCSAAAHAVDVEPLNVEINLRGKSMWKEEPNCEGGDWSLRWQGEFPGEGRNVGDLLMSYTAFDTTSDDEPIEPKPTFSYTPIVCRDKDGSIALHSTMSGGEPRIRGTVALMHNAAMHAPFFNIDFEQLGTCKQVTKTITLTHKNVMVAARTQQIASISPALDITRKDLEDGFSKTYRLGGQAIATDGYACMSPEISEGQLILSYKRKSAKPKVELSGCAHLARGATTEVQTKASPAGGSLSVTSDPAATMIAQLHGTSATITGAAPGRATLTARYILNGEAATATLPASSLELVSINGGAPIPKLGLYGVDGKISSKVYSFPFVTNPADSGDLISFTAENDAILSLLTKRSSLGIQPVREGQTILHAKTACGAPIGPPIAIEIVPCDDEVHGEVKRKQEELQRREQELVKRITQLVADPEFQRAATEIKQSTIELAIKTGELIAGALTAGEAAAAKNGVTDAVLNAEQLERVGAIWDGANVIVDGAVKGEWDKAMVGAFVMKLNKWQVSLAKTGWEAKEAAEKFGRDLGSIAGVAEQLENLEPQHDKIRQELYLITDRLHRCEKLPPPPPPPAPPKKPKPVPPKVETPPVPIETGPEPTPIPVPATTDVPPPDPIIDPPKSGGSVGLCVRPVNEEPDAVELRDIGAAATEYGKALQQSNAVFAEFNTVVTAVTAANALDGAARTDALKSLAPRYDAFLQQYYAVSAASRKQAERFTLCTAKLPAWINQIKTKY